MTAVRRVLTAAAGAVATTVPLMAPSAQAAECTVDRRTCDDVAPATAPAGLTR
ncbi:hypothetical protein ACIRBX_12595 [Kitasatospora sp. NPDC096147]|uniref:hypothetical protein n=1 Tax=Kitasatospora sp. NPDC096147 TaxID=3364093 RepID=UPI0037F279CE